MIFQFSFTTGIFILFYSTRTTLGGGGAGRFYRHYINLFEVFKDLGEEYTVDIFLKL